MRRLAILDDYQNVALDYADWSRLKESCAITVFDKPFANEDETVAALRDFHILCVMRERTPLPASVLRRLPRLELIVTTGAQNASIDISHAAGQGVVVCGTRSPGHAASELAFGLILSLCRQIPRDNERLRQGVWQTAIGRDVKGLTLGIVGLGRHGGNVAAYGQAFGMHVIAWSQNLEAARCDELNVELVGKDALFQRSDIVTVHLKMGQRNRDLIGARELALMKPTAYIVNTSRGPIINEAALLKALADKTIAGAGLDVYAQEPLPPDHPLLKTDNTILTSHTGYVTEQTYEVFYPDTVEAVAAYLAGKPIRILNRAR